MCPFPSLLPACADRLQDKSSLVRKEALRLLQALMLHNPFGPKLPVDRFQASLATHKAMLDQLLPPEQAQGDGLQENINLEGQEGGAAAEAGQEGGAEPAVKAEPGKEEEGPAEEMEVDGEGEPAQQEEAAAAAEGEEPEAQQPVQPVRSRECCRAELPSAGVCASM